MTAEEAFIKATHVRARAYYFIYDELCKEMGAPKAREVMSRAIYRLGQDKSRQYSDQARQSARALAAEFTGSPLSKAVFKQSVIEAQDKAASLKMEGCPLVDAWRQMGLAEPLVETLCDIAHQVDFGKVESLGYKLEFPARLACGRSECILNIQKV